jgi:plasmid stabilization system protein ParE
MQIRWSSDAVADLETIVDYIRRDNPAVAQRVGQTIYDSLSVLRTFPYGGRLGRSSHEVMASFLKNGVRRG